mgnify:CR=1 FL=1
MIEPKRIFVDTSAWIEHLLKKETYHKEVFDYLTKEVRSGSKFFTSDYVLDETYTRLLTNQSIKDAKNFKKYVKKAEIQKNLLVLWTDEVLFNKAWEYFEKFSEHKLSFTDATIYAFVKDLKIDEILTLDQGFKKVYLSVKPDLH